MIQSGNWWDISEVSEEEMILWNEIYGVSDLLDNFWGRPKTRRGGCIRGSTIHPRPPTRDSRVRGGFFSDQGSTKRMRQELSRGELGRGSGEVLEELFERSPVGERGCIRVRC